MEDRPKTVITYDDSGCRTFKVSGLGPRLESGIPSESIEWRRSFGRSTKAVGIQTKFEPASKSFRQVASNSGLRKLINHPVLHTFWTDCSDVDTYKASVKDEINKWLTQLKQVWGSNAEWMIVVVEIAETSARKSSKLLLQRTSALDKIKAEIAGGKQIERCVSLLDPARNDSRASDSWQTLLHRLRISILQAYNRILGRFEENMRGQRERRNDPKWSFCDYFLLQEELAFVYEMLGVYEDALLQYDELDALFTQFVLNSNVSESPNWLSSFSNEFSNWSGVSLKEDSEFNKQLRNKIVTKEPSLLDVRNYLFGRQSVILLKLNRPWEVARRCLSFLHNVVHELSILEVSCGPEGSVACWIFLSILEVVTTCEVKSKEAVARADDSNRTLSNAHVQQYCRYTAELWAYCRKKLYLLGKLCGLLPKSKPTSDQIHLVVELSSGIREDHYEAAKLHDSPTALIVKRKQNPVEKLKEALMSQSSFQKCYLELSEYAISTYKHIGRIRSARMVGLDLADFYLDLGQEQTAVTFLVDALKTFTSDGWDRLRLNSLMKAVDCYQTLGDYEKLVRTISQLICCPQTTSSITSTQRNLYFQKMSDALEKSESCLKIDSTSIINVVGCKIINKSSQDMTKVIEGTQLELQIDLESSFPATIHVSKLQAAVSFTPPNPKLPESPANDVGRKRQSSVVRKQGVVSVQRTPSTTSVAPSSVTSAATESEPASSGSENDDDETLGGWVERLKLTETVDFNQDSTANAVRIVCRNGCNVLRRKDSAGSLLPASSSTAYLSKEKADYKAGFEAAELVTVNPGRNRLILHHVAGPRVGTYAVSQLSILCFDGKLDILHDFASPHSGQKISSRSRSFEILSQKPVLEIIRPVNPEFTINPPLWAGIRQPIMLRIHSGSRHFTEGTEIPIKCSSGLFIGQNACNMSDEIVMKTPDIPPFSSFDLDMVVSANFPSDLQSAELLRHKLGFPSVTWLSDSSLELTFMPPIICQPTLKTASGRKYIQFSFMSTTEGAKFVIMKRSLKITPGEIAVRSLAPEDRIMHLSPRVPSNCLWEVEFPPDNQTADLGAALTLKYKPEIGAQDEEYDFKEKFAFRNSKTLYELRTRIDTVSGGELVRASSICAFSITIEQLHPTSHNHVMYEVLVDDQSEWAVCGRSAGVINMETARKQTVVVDVMALTGGHLLLPKVELYKYFPSGKNEQRSEKFALGEVYRCSVLNRIDVLPQLIANSSGTGSTTVLLPHAVAIKNHSPKSLVEDVMRRKISLDSSSPSSTSSKLHRPSSLLNVLIKGSPSSKRSNSFIGNNHDVDSFLDHASLP